MFKCHFRKFSFYYLSFKFSHSNGNCTGNTEKMANNGKALPSWSSQEIRGTVGNGGVPTWQCVPDRVYPVSGYGAPKNINQAAYQNRSNNNPDQTIPTMPAIRSPPGPMDANRNSATDDAKTTNITAGQSIKSSKSFESGVLGQHANTPNGIIPWPGDRKPRLSQWDHQHNYHNGSNNGTPSSPHNGTAAYSYNGGETFLGNRSSNVRSSSRGPTYFSPQHNHVSAFRVDNAC